MPFTPTGADRLRVELGRAREVFDPPRLVWVFDPDKLREHRASAYGWRDGAPPRVLVLWHEPGAVDRVEWVCEPYVRDRRE